MESYYHLMGIRVRPLCFLWFTLTAVSVWVVTATLCWLFTYLDPSYVAFFWSANVPYRNSRELLAELRAVPYADLLPKEKDQIGIVKTVDDLKIRDEGYRIYGFNALASRHIGEFREVPDTRPEMCKKVVYPHVSLTASIVICFYNEHLETLVRTVQSILRRTPSHLLHEIVLVDDYSDIPESLHEDVQKYIESREDVNGKVTLHKTEKREGLIRARMYGANLATGEVLVFLDSHVEVNIGWLEPLLSRIAQNRSGIVVTPIIDIIQPDTFEYAASPIVRGGFNWGLHFKWENLPVGSLKTKEDFTKPIRTPTMAGGLFAIDRKYFKDMGEYDAGMDIWGGENLELSFRVWSCGGTLEIIPCSKVGHVFRKHRPYTGPDGRDTMVKNSLRVAHVWLDEYKEYFFAERPESRGMHYGDVTDRVELRKRLGCKPFRWYLQNVYPELTFPNESEVDLRKKLNKIEKPSIYQRWDQRKRNYVFKFLLRLSNTTLCASPEKSVKEKGSSVILRSCLRSENQVWYQTDINEFVMAQLLCLDVGEKGYKPKLAKCHEMKGTQEWRYSSRKHTPVYNMAVGTCLAVTSPNLNSYLYMELCSKGENLNWDLLPI